MLKLKSINRLFSIRFCQMSTSKSKVTLTIVKSENKNETKKESNEVKLPDEPTNCCMSGCENCVWIQYAQELTEMYKDSGTTAKKIILEKIKDPSMQVFLKMELDTIKDKKPITIDDIKTRPPKEK